MYLAVTGVTPLRDYKLLLTFEGGEERIFDLKPYLDLGKFSELRDEAMFNSVKIHFDSIEWANQLDLDPEFLYQNSEVVPARAGGA